MGISKIAKIVETTGDTKGVLVEHWAVHYISVLLVSGALALVGLLEHFIKRFFQRKTSPFKGGYTAQLNYEMTVSLVFAASFGCGGSIKVLEFGPRSSKLRKVTKGSLEIEGSNLKSGWVAAIIRCDDDDLEIGRIRVNKLGNDVMVDGHIELSGPHGNARMIPFDHETFARDN